MTIIQALENTTARLEQFEAQMKSGVSREGAEIILAKSEKMNTALRIATFYIKRPDLCGNHAHLIEPLNKTLSLYVRVVERCIDRGFKACDKMTDKISRRFIQRLAELENEFEETPLQPIAASPMEASEGDLSLLTLPNLPNELLKKIFGSLDPEFLFVLRSTCKQFNTLIRLIKRTDPISTHRPSLFTILKSNDFCAKVTVDGHTRLLQWARAYGFPWSETTCAFAALGGHFETLKWARTNGCPWDARTCNYAASGGHLEMLQWARANECPWNPTTCACAAEKGHLEILQWARKNGCHWDEATCAFAAKNAHLAILQWARANGARWNGVTCANAALNGHLEIIKWAKANGCPWDIWTCACAAEKGHLEILKWARANGCPWDESTCSLAAFYGHLEVLQWAKENGAPWDEENIRKSAQNHVAVLKWLDSLETA